MSAGTEAQCDYGLLEAVLVNSPEAMLEAPSSVAVE